MWTLSPIPASSATARGIVVRLGALTLILATSGCGHAPPVVEKTVIYDEKGRAVVSYRICEQVSLFGGTACRTETVVHNYCYRSLGRVDCYEDPQPGRTAMEIGP